MAEEEVVDATVVAVAVVVVVEEETDATAAVAEVPRSVPIKVRPVGPENVTQMEVAIKDVVEEEEEEEDADQEDVEEEDVAVAVTMIVKSKNQPRQKN